jgi:hypothetical protein
MTTSPSRSRTLQAALFTVGAVLMPAGVAAVFFGWWGAAHARYSYDQFPYLLSGGLMGVCLTTLGGFLYFGAWQARVAEDQRKASRQMAEAVAGLGALLARQSGAAGNDVQGAEPVVAGTNGAAVHRRDCGLIAHRDDIRVLTAADSGLSVCRVCNPVLA